MHVYLDVPTTPSVPYTSSREALTYIRVRGVEPGRKSSKSIPISELPLVGSIAGFMDLLRVYTTPEHRNPVGKAASELFGGNDFVEKVSM
jgi:hypothetical protein